MTSYWGDKLEGAIDRFVRRQLEVQSVPLEESWRVRKRHLEEDLDRTREELHEAIKEGNAEIVNMLRGRIASLCERIRGYEEWNRGV